MAARAQGKDDPGWVSAFKCAATPGRESEAEEGRQGPEWPWKDSAAICTERRPRQTPACRVSVVSADPTVDAAQVLLAPAAVSLPFLPFFSR